MLFIDGNGRHGDVLAEGCQSRERDKHLLKKERDQQTSPAVEFKKYCRGCGTGARNLSSLQPVFQLKNGHWAVAAGASLAPASSKFYNEHTYLAQPKVCRKLQLQKKKKWCLVRGKGWGQIYRWGKQWQFSFFWFVNGFMCHLYPEGAAGAASKDPCFRSKPSQLLLEKVGSLIVQAM